MLLYVIGGVLALGVLAVVWGVLHLRHSHRVASEAIRRVRIEEIQSLARECEEKFQEAFGETLTLENLEASARALSARLDNAESLKQAFQKPDFYWYFALPVGAYLGELMRVHAKGEWHVSEEGGLELRVPVKGDSATTYPFDKVLKQVTMGDKGDIYAYLMTSTQLDAALEGLETKT